MEIDQAILVVLTKDSGNLLTWRNIITRSVFTGNILDME
jgi:hypothetical protein